MVIVTLMARLTKDLRPFVDIDKTEEFIIEVVAIHAWITFAYRVIGHGLYRLWAVSAEPARDAALKKKAPDSQMVKSRPKMMG